MTSLFVSKRIKNPCTCVLHICNIAGYQRQIVDLGGCRQEAVNRGAQVRRVHTPPFVGDSLVNQQDAPGKSSGDSTKPLFQNYGFGEITRARKFDSFTETNY